MKAIRVKAPGGAEQLELGEFPTPEPGEAEIRVAVKATALNRADILQREGKYPPPPGASPLLGLEMAGIVDKTGPGCRRWHPGDRVFALLPGGGYAQYATVHEDLALPIPDSLTFEEAAAIPEAFLTAYQVLHWIARLQQGEFVLIHAGASGVGTAAIQLVKQAGAFPVVTAGSEEKIRFCQQLGAIGGLNYKKGSFVEGVMALTRGHGADVIIDPVGAPYWQPNLSCLAMDGRIVMIATMGGTRVPEVNLRDLFKKRAQITATTLRSRSLDYKIRLTREFQENLLPLFTSGVLKPIIDRVFPWEQVQEAHRYMEANRNIGKIVLRITND
ncbi:MAG: NAD(P)H-quinone oxidoreductase [Calditrichaeota bacterium]|nr:NAD(P)H-quinone oxidoreductase [Calditrichota bacterium]